MSMVVKRVFNAVISFHCDRDERRHCQFQCNIYMVEIENLYASRNDMLISIILNFILLQIISTYRL